MADRKLSFVNAYEGTVNPIAQTSDGSGQIKCQLVHWPKVAADTDGDQIFLMPVKSSDRIIGIYRANDALTGATDLNIGLWSTDSTPTDVDENLFADAVNIASAQATWSQIDEIAVEDRGKPIWSLLGQTAPEDKTYFLAINCVTAGTAEGDVAIRVEFLI